MWASFVLAKGVLGVHTSRRVEGGVCLGFDMGLGITSHTSPVWPLNYNYDITYHQTRFHSALRLSGFLASVLPGLGGRFRLLLQGSSVPVP